MSKGPAALAPAPAEASRDRVAGAVSGFAADGALARTLATAAGRELLDVRAQPWSDAKALRDAGDAQSHNLLVEALAQHHPHDAVLSEEGADDPARLRADRVWIVDPLDGTREFSEPGRSDWAVHVALWERGELVAGAVALPALGVTFATDDPAQLPTYHGGQLRLAVSRTRPPALVDQLAATLDLELVPMGSAGAKVLAVVRGEVDAYVHAGGQYEWDSAAPVVVARAAGAHASRIDGTPLEYNRADPLLPDLLVCRPEHATRLLAAIANDRQEGDA
jgi:3'(2'), 5'-bisphosphate nucleotidase